MILDQLAQKPLQPVAQLQQQPTTSLNFMNCLIRSLLTAMFVAMASSQAHASFLFTLTQVGPDVVATGSGTLNLTALNFQGAGTDSPIIQPSYGILGAGPTGSAVSEYSGILGTVTPGFGSGGQTFATSGTGNYVAIVGIGAELDVPSGYTSGSSLTNSATFANTTLTMLGATPGTYTRTWGSGITADSLTVNIVPEPSTLVALFMSGATLLGLRFYRRGA